LADRDQLADGAALVSVEGADDGASDDDVEGELIGARLSVVPLDPLEPHAATAIVATSASIAITAFMKRPPRWVAPSLTGGECPSHGHRLVLTLRVAITSIRRSSRDGSATPRRRR
jgi:hypothetical protein